MTTKLKKVNELLGTLEDVYPNLIIISGKSIAVPVDKKHIIVNTGAKTGDIIRVKYDERGYLLEAEVVSKGPEELKPKEPEKKPTVSILEAAIQGQAPDTKKQPEPIKEYVSLERRVSLHQTTYKECCETARCLMLIPDGAFDETEYNRLLDVALARSIKDAQALIDAAGGGK